MDSDNARNRIDVHAHYIPDFYREALIDAGLGAPDGIRELPAWDEEAALRTMDQLQVGTAMLSISSPGVHLGDDIQASDLARRVNEEVQRLRHAHPGRFGHFASLPLPNVERAVTEATHALDALGADGIVLETNARGIYLGDPQLEPLYSELDRRHAVIFVHPTTPAARCCGRLDARYPQPMLEFIFDTTRSVSDMILSGVLERFPHLRVIVPHAGAALSILMERVELLLPLLSTSAGDAPPSIRQALRNLHFDLAGVPVPQQLDALLQVADAGHFHYGSDYPFTPVSSCVALARALQVTPLLDEATRTGMWGENARSLFPRLGIRDQERA
jgi:predicted TIM-barrel fold metal-dependent hydrolase